MTAPVLSRPAADDPHAVMWLLVERAQAGDADAFAEIYARYVDTVFRFIYYRVRDRPLTEDLTSETFLRAIKRIGSFTWQGRDLGAWLHTIARNLVTDHFKSGRCRLEAVTATGDMPDQVDPQPGTAEQVIARLTAADLAAAMRQLGAEQHRVLTCRYLDDMSVAETARAMGKNEGAIKALTYRAIRALARDLPRGPL